MRRLLLCGVFAVLGCEERKRGEYSATEPTVKSSKGVTPSPSPELPVYKPAVKAEEKTEPAQPKPVDPKTAAFWAGMAKFIEESRSLTRAMELLPDRAVYKKRVEQVQEAYSRIPDPPAANTLLKEIHRVAKKTALLFEVGGDQLAGIEELLRLGAKKEAAEVAKIFLDGGSQMRNLLDVMEAAASAEGFRTKPPS